jgi:hypothetical protein
MVASRNVQRAIDVPTTAKKTGRRDGTVKVMKLRNSDRLANLYETCTRECAKADHQPPRHVPGSRERADTESIRSPGRSICVTVAIS